MHQEWHEREGSGRHQQEHEWCSGGAVAVSVHAGVSEGCLVHWRKELSGGMIDGGTDC